MAPLPPSASPARIRAGSRLETPLALRPPCSGQKHTFSCHTEADTRARMYCVFVLSGVSPFIIMPLPPQRPSTHMHSNCVCSRGALAEYDKLVEVEEGHPVVFVAVLLHAVQVDRLLEHRPRRVGKRHEAAIDELLNLW